MKQKPFKLCLKGFFNIRRLFAIVLQQIYTFNLLDSQ